MVRFLLRFWPVLIPICCFLVWRRLARKRGSEMLPVWEARLWLATLAATLIVGAFSAWLWVKEEGEGQTGIYVPAHLENGAIVPGHNEPVEPR